jgi:hypothetical protein
MRVLSFESRPEEHPHGIPGIPHHPEQRNLRRMNMKQLNRNEKYLIYLAKRKVELEDTIEGMLCSYSEYIELQAKLQSN